jgi:transposase InsO family protein
MNLKLHANATTTPKTRAYIQASTASVSELAAELGVHETTIRRWRSRTDVADRSTQPHRLSTSLAASEEALVIELRLTLELPLDDIVEVMRRCVNGQLSRSAIHRCLKRHGISAPKAIERHKPQTFETASPCGFIHLDIKYLSTLGSRRAYAFVAIDRATRYVYVEILYERSGAAASAFLERFVKHFPHPVHTVLTDNGGEWTDRFAVDKKGKPKGQPSGEHPLDRLCARRGIRHRLTKPFRPQTNGMVERFNRRLGEHLDRIGHNTAGHHRRFKTAQERDAYVLDFVTNYNRTRLRCLSYKAPLEALANLTGHYTKAGAPLQVQREWQSHRCRLGGRTSPDSSSR